MNGTTNVKADNIDGLNAVKFKNLAVEKLIDAKQVVLYVFLRVSTMHNGILPFAKIRDYLLDGGHKMPKIATDERKEEVENIVLNLNLKEIEKVQYITIN